MAVVSHTWIKALSKDSMTKKQTVFALSFQVAYDT